MGLQKNSEPRRTLSPTASSAAMMTMITVMLISMPPRFEKGSVLRGQFGYEQGGVDSSDAGDEVVALLGG